MDEGKRNMTNERDQVHRAYDDSPQRFLDGNEQDKFAGADSVLFEQAMAQTRMAICLSDPHADDFPVVFANRAFLELTGYLEDEVVGRNCRFLQGPETDPVNVAKVRTAIEDETVVVVELLNYRKDGTRFWNALHLGPIYNEDGKLLYYFGSQWDVSDVHAARAEEEYAKTLSRELSHRMKNMFAVIGSIVNITGRTHDIRSEARMINERIQALGRAYEPTLDEASLGSIELGQAMRSVLAPYDPEDRRIRYLGNGLRADPNFVSVVGLSLHELATNAVKHGAFSNETGTVSVDWKHRDAAHDTPEQIEIEWIERGGPQVAQPVTASGSGHSIMQSMVAMAGGTITYDWKSDGLAVTIAIPHSGSAA